MAAERWKRRLTLVYILPWAFWALLGLSTIVNYPYSRDGYRYPRVVAGTFLACVVMPAFMLGILRQAVDRFTKKAPGAGLDESSPTAL